MAKLSVVIITKNEERNIARCLDSVKDIADEIIILDSCSEDGTKEICAAYDVKFQEKEWLGYAESKNYANSLASHDLLFSIDADEEVSDTLKKEIARIKSEDSPRKAYEVRRLTNYCGTWIRHCGWYPDEKVRIWHRDQGRWEGLIHEQVLLDPACTVETLAGDLYHYSYYSVSQHIEQANRFTDAGALHAFRKGTASNIVKIILFPCWKFIRDYFFKAGFLDGYFGFIICVISSHATFLKYAKLLELQKKEES
ncbi:MAG: glycosyltransferase family 2 protein [Nitrospiraceae bacterium]|nr:MAG: glycosyltransferase family 2 protein [Nitrospiraceae bacterium]